MGEGDREALVESWGDNGGDALEEEGCERPNAELEALRVEEAPSPLSRCLMMVCATTPPGCRVPETFVRLKILGLTIAEGCGDGAWLASWLLSCSIPSVYWKYTSHSAVRTCCGVWFSCAMSSSGNILER
mmetsp:Transcript_14945/g.30039  ORF Transcript_14945/g.30039 Transcript_14945/m.30039 type:complete len:130 (-) Transcript_14945:32-421(-)